MAKDKIKDQVIQTRGRDCEISGERLPEDDELFDLHRHIPKKDGGEIVLNNVGVVAPVAHMAEHGSLRVRTPEQNELKTLMDDRNQIIKLKNKIENQLRAYRRLTDTPNVETVLFLNEQLVQLGKIDKKKERGIIRFLTSMEDPLVQAALKIVGVGPITVSSLTTYVDLTVARHASSLWAYCGYDKPNHLRYVKGQSGGGNKTLRTALFNTGHSFIRSWSPYVRVFYSIYVPAHYRFTPEEISELPKKQRDHIAKLRREHPELVGRFGRLDISDRVVLTKNTQGDLVESTWREAKPSHRMGAALRKMIKHFLADYWYVGRTLLGLETSPIYAEAVLGGEHRTIMPEERGWEY